jgi:hypothetical protein
MMKLNFILLFTVSFLLGFFIKSYSQYIDERVPKDTIDLGKYCAIYYQVTGSDGFVENEYDLFYGGKKILTSPRWAAPLRIYRYCRVENYSTEQCLLKDINNDGKLEIIFYFPCGGTDPSEDYFIYSLDTVATLVMAFDEFRNCCMELEDIDGDGIDEIIICDLNFHNWNLPNSGEPCPKLVWKWDKNRYRLANFKLADQLLKRDGYKDDPLLKDSIKRWVEIFYGRKGEDPYPPDVWFVMLEYIYAGKYAKSDSVFKELWPKEVANKDKFYKEFWDQVKSGYFWPTLLKSDW